MLLSLSAFHRHQSSLCCITASPAFIETRPRFISCYNYSLNFPGFSDQYLDIFNCRLMPRWRDIGDRVTAILGVRSSVYKSNEGSKGNTAKQGSEAKSLLGTICRYTNILIYALRSAFNCFISI